MTEENKKSLMKKTKSELIEIIARKDDTEQKYAGTVKELEANVAELSDELTLKLNVIKSYEEGNSEFGEECESLKNKIKQLEYDKNQIQINCAEWKANYDEVFCECNKYKGISRVLTVISVALLGAVMIMIF